MYPIKVNPEVISQEYLLWLLLSDTFTAYAEDESKRSRMPKLNRQQLFSYQARIPPHNKQKEIAIYLTQKMRDSNHVINQINDQIRLIEELPGSFLRQAFTGEL